MYTHIKFIILFILILILSTNIYAQNIKFEHLSIAEGLSQSVVLCILQDSKGFIWIGTEDGLNKYDGYKFTVYKHNQDNPNTLSNNYIWSIYEDKSGILWVGTSNGLSKFDLAHETVVRYQHDENDPNSLSHNDVRAIVEDNTGTLWIGTYGGGLNKFDRNTKTFVRYQHDANNPKSLSNNVIHSIYEDSAGTLWIATAKGLNKFDRDTETFKHYLDDEATTSIYEVNENESESESESESGGTLWIGTDGEGLYQFNPGSETDVHYQYDVNNPDGLNNNYINNIYQDNAGGVWIGTWGGGLNKWASSKKFRHYQHQKNDPNSLSGNAVWSIYEDSHGVLWISTEGDGFNKFDRSTGKFVHYQSDENNPNSLINNDVYGIIEAQKGALWIGTWEGLDKFDPGLKKTVVHYQHEDNNPNSLIHNNINTIYKDRMGFLWIGTWGYGLDKFDPKTEIFLHYEHDDNNSRSLSDNQVNAIYEDRFGVLWIGTVAGLDKFDQNTETFVHYQYDDKNPNSLSSGQVYAIYEDSRGRLWIGTAGGGLNQFNRATASFSHYREKDGDGGLPNDTINHILEDDQGYLWLSTNKGLSKFNPQMGTFRNYDVNDGLQSNEFIWGSGYKSRSGELLFGGVKGFNLFQPEKIKDNPFIPPVVITDFHIFNQSVSIGGDSPLQQHINSTKELTLSHQDSVFSFEFAALNYTSPQKNQYAYQLEGIDKNWVYVNSDRRFATYTNLDAGDYVFKVKGTNNDGLWNEEGTSLKITIIPPWWKTWWAYGLYIILVLAMIVGFVRIQRKKLIEKQKNEERLRQFLEAVPVGVFIVDAKEQPYYINQAAQHIIGKGIVSETTVDQLPEVYQAYLAGTDQLYPNDREPLALALKGDKTSIEDMEIHRDDRIIPLEVWGTPIFDEQGNISYAMSVFKDITERKQAESDTIRLAQERKSKEVALGMNKKIEAKNDELAKTLEELKGIQAQLIESEKMASLGGLVAGVAHEINTPLGIGITAASTLANKTETTATAYDNKQLKGSALKTYFDKARRSSRLILDNLDRAGELVQNFKKVAVDQTHLDRRTFAVKKYFEESLVNLTPHLKKTSFMISVDGDDQIEIESYPGAFSQIITNLVMNSLIHAYKKGEAGHLSFNLRRESESEQLFIEYKDDGCGIPSDNLSKIFEPFFTTNRAQGGTGLGLHIVYNLVTQKLKGTIRCESEVGVGTRFIINLPCPKLKL